MRDINRIEPFMNEFMNELTEIWYTVPDWRFGQLIENFKKFAEVEDLFYIEDDKMLEVLKKFKEELK